MSAYDDLMAFQRETEALGQIAGRLGWDQETMMPRGAAEQRGEEMAAIEGVLHARRSDPRVGDWLAAAKPDDAVATAQLREIRRSYERSTKVPAKLASEIARVTSVAQGIWAEARASEDWDTFQPVLENVVRLRREEGEALANGGDVYNALLQDYEPGTTADEVEAMFAALRPGLVSLRERILGSSVQPSQLDAEFPEDGQLALSAELATAFGYGTAHGRIDKAVHPFSSGSGADARITTRTDPADPFNCLYSTLHEVGHATYEQNIDPALALTVLGQGASMGVHESQSRLYENQLGRSRAFCGWLHGRLRDRCGDAVPGDADAVFLPGGYPELHSHRPAASENFKTSLRDAAQRSATVYGECGGYMTLGKGLIDAEGVAHEMASLLPVTTSFAKRKLSLGYRNARLLSPLGAVAAGHVVATHEFHYSTVAEQQTADALFIASDALGNDLGAVGLQRGSVSGSYLHMIDLRPAAA